MNYVIQPGDTLGAIAARFGTTVEAIVAANGIAKPDEILAGATIKIPVATAPVTTPTAPTGATGGISDIEAKAVIDAFIANRTLDPALAGNLFAQASSFSTMQDFADWLEQFSSGTTADADGAATPTGDVTIAPDVPIDGGGAAATGITSGGGHFVTVNFITNDGSAGQANIFFPSAVWAALLASPLADKYGLNQTDPVITLGQFANFKADVQTSISGPLLSVANQKLNALDSVAADANINLPPVSPEMANSGIAWAIDPVSGRPELIDTKPFFGPPVSSFQFIPTDPNNPSGGGSWTLVATDDTKSIFEGVPSSVRGWLQLALDAGGDTSVVPAGPARAWVAFILGQASGSSRRPPTELPFGFGLPEFEGGRPGASIVAPDPDMFGDDAPVIPIPDELVPTVPPDSDPNTGGVDTGPVDPTEPPPAAPPAPIVPPADTGVVTPPSPTVTPLVPFEAPEITPDFIPVGATTGPTPTPTVTPPTITVAPEIAPGFVPVGAVLPPPSVVTPPGPVVGPPPPIDAPELDPDFVAGTVFPSATTPTNNQAELESQQLTLQILINSGAPPIVIAAQQTKIDALVGV